MLPRPYKTFRPKDEVLARLERNAADFAEELREKVLNGGLGLSNLRGQVLEVSLTAPAAGVSLNRVLPLSPTFPAAPQVVTLLGAVEDTGDVLSGLTLRWRPDRAGQYLAVRIVQVDGLTEGRTYTLRLLVLPPE